VNTPRLDAPRTPAPARWAALLLSLAGTTALAAEADRFAAVKVTAVPVAGSVYMLVGAGGNIGLSLGEDGTLIIDDEFAPLAERIQATIDKLGGNRPKLILNTHYHGDHTGSNPFFGHDGTIIAQDNVRARLERDSSFDRAGLPVVTFEQQVHVHFNGEEIDVIHLPAGHTDGDSVVWFKTSRVLHAGDDLFNGHFPFIDLDAGGSVSGYIKNLNTLLTIVPDDVRVIPGHGDLTDKAGLRRNLEMIESTYAAVHQKLAQGMSDEAIVAAGVAPEWKSFNWEFVDEQRWLNTLIADARAARSPNPGRP